MIEALLASSPELCVVVVDVRNAHTAIDRMAVRAWTATHWPELLPYFEAKYGVVAARDPAVAVRRKEAQRAYPLREGEEGRRDQRRSGRESRGGNRLQGKNNS